MISTIICTRNRPKKIVQCVKSIFSQDFDDKEVIVIDLSSNTETRYALRQYIKSGLRYFKLKHRVKTKGLNFGIKKSRGQIIAFTDDDCVAPKNWLSAGIRTLSKFPDAAAVFGQTKSYRPDSHRGMFCPSTFSISKTRVVTKPAYHAKHIGFGNNMFIKKTTFDKTRLFKTWLGPGSIGRTAEDAEMAIRILKNGLKIVSAKDVLIYHDRWLNKKEFEKLLKDYMFGEIVCYSYIALKGEVFAKRLIYKDIKLVVKQKIFNILT